mmetsp:Transcript_32346/g.68399  ORF Transcript_32346/g.68399 Transcript_32346/m.68399 type:complete len:226 (+) Transcript_32346:811-1488(+)
MVRQTLIQLVRIDQISILDGCFQNDWRGTDQQRHFGIARPIRRGHDHLVSRAAGSQQPLVHALFRTVPHDYLRDGIIFHPLPRLQVLGDGVAQIRCTGHGRVPRLTRLHRLGGSVEDGQRRGEIRLAHAERRDGFALRLHLFDKGKDLDRFGGLDLGEERVERRSFRGCRGIGMEFNGGDAMVTIRERRWGERGTLVNQCACNGKGIEERSAHYCPGRECRREGI